MAGLGLGALGSMMASCGGAYEPDVPASDRPASGSPTSTTIARADEPPRKLPGPLVPAVSDWMLSLFPIEEISDDWDHDVELIGWNPDLERYVAKGVGDRSYWDSMRGTFYDIPDERWRWDLYLGLVPFVEMANLVRASVIEPWEPHLPSAVADSWIPSVKDEATHDGQIYSYPFGTSIVAAGWHEGLVEAADLDPDHVPATWDEWIHSARQVMDRGVAPFGAAFNPNGWLSLAPIAHSIDSDIYTEDGLFDFTHEAVVEALEIMRRLTELSQPEEAGFASEGAAYYFDHVYAALDMASRWSDPGLLRIGALPSVPGGAGGTVFWSVGGGLFIDGYHKKQSAEYMSFVSRNEQLHQADIGNHQKQTVLLQPYETVWKEWSADPPRWLPNWAFALKDQLSRSRSIPILQVGEGEYPYYQSGVAQFLIGRNHWETYLLGDERDPRVALENAKQAVLAEIG